MGTLREALFFSCHHTACPYKVWQIASEVRRLLQNLLECSPCAMGSIPGMQPERQQMLDARHHAAVQTTSMRLR